MKAFHNDAKLKSDLLVEITKHEQADAIIKGSYGSKGENGIFKGCAVGCSIESYNKLKGLGLSTTDHSVYESEFGIPRVLAHLEDGFFEGMSETDGKTWPRQFIEAVPVGADLSLVWPKFAVWMLTDTENGVIRHVENTNVRKTIQDISDTYVRVIQGEEVTVKEWLEKRAASATYAAASYATTAASYATTASYATAYAFAFAAASYATTAVTYADSYAASYASRQSHFKIMADKLLEIIKEAV